MSFLRKQESIILPILKKAKGIRHPEFSLLEGGSQSLLACAGQYILLPCPGNNFRNAGELGKHRDTR